MHTLESLINTPRAFRNWLERQEPDASVGLSRNYRHNPIARFLSDTLHLDAPVSPYWTGEGRAAVITPRWASLYITHLGDHYAQDGVITARIALAIYEWCAERVPGMLAVRS